MVGSAVVDSLKQKGVRNIITRCSSELDLINQADVDAFFKEEQPDCVFFAAARVGGVQWYLSEPSRFLYENTMMSLNVIQSAHAHGVKFFVNIGSSCVYANNSPQPYKEDYNLHGPFEPTNEGYTLSKLMGVKMCEIYSRQFGFDVVTILPSSLYGIKASYDPKHSHVVASLIKRIHKAKNNKDETVTAWGTGAPRRELLFSEDVGNGIVHLGEVAKSGDIVNIGADDDIAIKDLADMIAEVIGYEGKIIWDISKPDGVIYRRLSCEKQKAMGWTPKYTLREGLEKTYEYYLKEIV